MMSGGLRRKASPGPAVPASRIYRVTGYLNSPWFWRLGFQLTHRINRIRAVAR
jgi:hypothetical protein